MAKRELALALRVEDQSILSQKEPERRILSYYSIFQLGCSGGGIYVLYCTVRTVRGAQSQPALGVSFARRRPEFAK